MDDFSNSIKQALLNKARIDKFVMVMNLPPCLQTVIDNEQINNEKISSKALFFAVSGAGVPTQKIPAAEARFSGQSMKLTSHSRPAWDETTVTMTIDNQFANYWAVDRWLNVLNDQRESSYGLGGNIETGRLPEYSTDFSIFALDEFDQTLVEFKYKNCFPTTLGEIRYSYKDITEIEAPISFAFSQVYTLPKWT